MPIVKLPSGDLRDEIRQPIYDSVDLTGDGSTLQGIRTFFQNVAGKSKAQTNMTQGGKLATATSFRVQGYALDAHCSIYAARERLPLLLENSSIFVQIGEKKYWESPLRYVAGRLSETLSTFDASQHLMQFGWPAVSPVILGSKHVVDINPLQEFYAQMTTDALTAAEIASAGDVGAGRKIRLTFSMKGLLRRPVQ